MAPRKRLSGSAPASEVAMVAVAIEPVGMETAGTVNTEDTGDCVVVPDNMTSCNQAKELAVRLP